jgi:hypothetical protein
MRAAIIVDGKVDNIIEVDTLDALPEAVLIEAPAAHIGDAWDGEAFISPEQPDPPAPPRHITCLAFRNRFTADEKVMIELTATDNPGAAIEDRKQSARLRANMADVSAASFIDLDRLDTRAGVQMLEDVGVIEAGRALQILDAEIQANERPVGL